MDTTLIVSSAGCGKTTTLLNRLVERLEEGVEPEKVAFVTFTKAGAEVARKRASEQLNIPLSKLKQFSTVHSMAFHALGASKDMMMNQERYTALGNSMNMNLGRYQSKFEDLNWDELKSGDIARLDQVRRNNLKYFNELMTQHQLRPVDMSQLMNFSVNYRSFRRVNKYYDFTDLLEEYDKNNMEQDAEVAFIDEAQDLTELQWRVCLKGFRNCKHIYIAGDPKQSVYAFQGAKKDFVNDFVAGHIEELSVAYRVPSKILEMGNKIAGMIDTTYNYPCRANREGGKVSYVSRSGLFACPLDPNLSYLFLCRGNKQREVFREMIEAQGFNYMVDGLPVLNKTEIAKARLGLKGSIPYAKQCKVLDNPERRRIATIHASKGDEADVVFLLSDVPPFVFRSMQSSKDAMDNEHRIFYVAVTRAKQSLVIVEPETRYCYGGIL